MQFVVWLVGAVGSYESAKKNIFSEIHWKKSSNEDLLWNTNDVNNIFGLF